MQHWAADGLLAIFFFVAGIELKRELVAGELRDPKAAALPVIAAVCGMAVPALVYTLVNVVGNGSLGGWAVPTATDIAFALAVLAVIGTSLPSALRAFLLTLAVVDDLFAILIIAVFFTSSINFAALGGAVARARRLLAAAQEGRAGLVRLRPARARHLGADVQQRRARHHRRCRDGPDAPLPPHRGRGALPRRAHRAPGAPALGRPRGAAVRALLGRRRHQRRRARPTSSPGPRRSASCSAWSSARQSASSAAPGSPARFTKAELNDDLAWPDVFAVASLAGIGFTVSLLIGELAFGGQDQLTDEVKAAVLMGSLIAAVLSSVLLKLRVRKYKALVEDEERDDDQDGIPDIYEMDKPEYHLRMAAIYENKAAEHRRLAQLAGAGRDDGDSPA